MALEVQRTHRTAPRSLKRGDRHAADVHERFGGPPVQPLAAFYKLTPAELLVVCDDFNLPFGRLRLRRGGSDGGNNGLKDITSALGTQEYSARLQIRDQAVTAWMRSGSCSARVQRRRREGHTRGDRSRPRRYPHILVLQGTDAAIAVVNSNNGDAVP